MQELDQTIDERLLWEFISAQNEIKVAMLSNDFVHVDNIDQVFEEYVSLKRWEWKNYQRIRTKRSAENTEQEKRKWWFYL